jgi:hypothetical protein
MSNPMPKVTDTPLVIRAIRVDDPTWDAALARAQDEGISMSALVRGWLADYAAGKSRVGPGRPAGVEISRAELTKLRELVDRILQ